MLAGEVAPDKRNLPFEFGRNCLGDQHLVDRQAGKAVGTGDRSIFLQFSSR